MPYAMLTRAVGAGILAQGILVAGSALSPVDTFYPPGLNDTSYISNGALGTYGGIYTAPADEPSQGSPYGVYDYCSMPHPRVSGYELPGDGRAKLVHLEYLQRHQRRTMYNLAPGGEPFDCSTFEGYLYGSQVRGTSGLEVFADVYTDPSNPFVDALPYVNSTCFFPQLTTGGFLDGVQHGRDLWALYGERLGLIPDSPDDKVWLRSSSSPLTQQSAGGVLRGLWPHYAGSAPLRQQPGPDTVNNGYPCNARGSILSSIQSTDEWSEHLSATAELRQSLGDILGATSGSWQNTFDHFSDNFQARLCNGYRLPCSFADPSACVSQQQAEEVFRAGDWEWNHYWRNNPLATRYIQVTEGLFLGEIVGRLQAVLAEKQQYVYAHTFIHDGDIGPVLGALGINQLRWPAMGSNVAIEVWETAVGENKTHYARVLYSGHTLRTIHGDMDWVPLSRLIDILRVYVPKDVVALCNS
ncbi:histidine phosphatase superfamily [Trichoderma cornu-damae]|uniref:Histidine phosphatase superfamily n=1 Tax=Trichoderma cornu-damae TaxID=654480 RepID=A0A9P8QHZ6_9HYPO|nr:histidine phosphatase superfamily [Trichoderma cornu-damae]